MQTYEKFAHPGGGAVGFSGFRGEDLKRAKGREIQGG